MRPVEPRRSSDGLDRFHWTWRSRPKKVPRHYALEFVSTAAIDPRVASGVDANADAMVSLTQMFRQTVGYCAATLPGRSSGGVKSTMANFSFTIGTIGGCMH